jgi:hypothetical protein
MNLTAIIAAILALANALDKKGVLSFEEYRDALLSMYREMPHEDASGDAGHIFDGMLSQLERYKESQETNVNGGGPKVISYDLENQS